VEQQMTKITNLLSALSNVLALMGVQMITKLALSFVKKEEFHLALVWTTVVVAENRHSISTSLYKFCFQTLSL
jgi:hypothetical protein